MALAIQAASTVRFLLLHQICAPGHRVRGEAKEDRDLVVRAMCEMKLSRNEDIALLFGLSYSAVSHIVRDVKELIKKDPRVETKAKGINSQFKI